MPGTDHSSSVDASRSSELRDLEGFLSELKREPQPFLFIPNPGNAGDALIAHATRQLFDRLGLEYVWVNDLRRFDPRGRVVVYGGGGNLVPLYSDASRALRWADGNARRLILLPHTVSGHEQLLSELGPQTELICRERVSYDHVRGSVRSARCYLADDLALSVDTESTLAAPPGPPAALPLHVRRLFYRLIFKPSLRGSVASPRRLRYSDRLFAYRLAELEGDSPSGVLHAFRTDAERIEGRIPGDNQDLSRLLFFGTRSAEICHVGALHLLRYLDLFDEVRTNRLHLAVGAAVLGKRVKLYPNSYFKNRAVYEYSMRDRFPDVEWVDEAGG